MTRGIIRFAARNSVALIALFVALGGTTYAATALAPQNSVNSAAVINGSLKTKDLSKTAVRALKGNRGLRGFIGAQGQRGATGVQGAQGVPGAAGSALAYAEVGTGGALIPGRFKNISQANISSGGSGIFCFGGLSFTPSNVQAIRQGEAGTPGLASYIMGASGTCAAGTQVTVTIRVWDGTAKDFADSNNNVMVLFN